MMMPEVLPETRKEGFAKPMMPARKDARTGWPESSPLRPPVSPITPSATLAQLASAPASIHPPLSPQLDGTQDETPDRIPRDSALIGQDAEATQDQALHSALARDTPNTIPTPRTIPPPDPVELEEEENTDIAAVRAALAILHHQKEQSERDIRTLQTLKRRLRQDPARFTEELASGKMREEKVPSDPLNATFPRGVLQDIDGDLENEVSADSVQDDLSYPKIPSQQNVVRCPPINWNKYHIIGQPLDTMHEEQRKRPSEGQPSFGPIPQAGNPFYKSSSTPTGPPAPIHHIHKPYDPFSDNVQSGSQRDGVQTRRSTKMP